MTSQRPYLFTGGGTGGHVTPSLAMAEAIRARHPDATFRYVGVKGRAEESMVPKAWAEDMDAGRASLHFVRSRGYPGLGPALLPFALDLGLGVVKALLLLLRFRPRVIIATGGYVAAPILFAAYLLRRLRFSKTRIFLHEQNAVLGRMNALAVTFADKVGVAFPDTQVPAVKKAYVGYPVRAAVAAKRTGDPRAHRAEARKILGIPEDARIVFAFGGSLGARTINRGLVDALPCLLEDPKVWVVHGTGKQLSGSQYSGARDVRERLEGRQDLPEGWQDRYISEDFFHDMGLYYAASGLVVCRGGAGSLSEVCANGVAAVVIPKANLPGDHQAYNARVLDRRGAVKVIYERVDVTQGDAVESVDPAELARIVLELLRDPARREAMVRAAVGLYNPQTSDLTAALVDSMIGEAKPPTLPPPPALTHEKVLGLNSNQLEKLLKGVRAGREQLTEEERRLALYKIDGYLASDSYIPQARGCRMVGLASFSERLPILRIFATGAGPHGGFRKLPIVRRDAFVGLKLSEDDSPETLECLKKGLDEPYFEARNKATEAVSYLAQRDEPPVLQPLVEKLIENVSDSSFEVRVSSIEALGHIIDDFSRIEEAWKGRRFDSHWKVRSALLRGLAALAKRGIITEAQAAREGNEVLRTSDGYETTFPIKVAFEALPGRDTLEGV